MKITKLIPGMPVVALAVAACSSVPMKGHETRIESTPAGADVYADGVKIGKTPMSIQPNEVFPPKWQNWEYQASGVLIIRKAGCEEYAVRVNDGLLRKGIQAKLDCSMKPVRKQEVTSTEEKGPVSTTPVPGRPGVVTNGAARKAAGSGDIEMRLKEAERLFKKGVITRDEYEKTRARILKEL